MANSMHLARHLKIFAALLALAGTPVFARASSVPETPAPPHALPSAFDDGLSRDNSLRHAEPCI